jgi:hypothetical protein
LFLTRTKEPLYTICGNQQKNKNFKMSRIGWLQ